MVYHDVPVSRRRHRLPPLGFMKLRQKGPGVPRVERRCASRGGPAPRRPRNSSQRVAETTVAADCADGAVRGAGVEVVQDAAVGQSRSPRRRAGSRLRSFARRLRARRESYRPTWIRPMRAGRCSGRPGSSADTLGAGHSKRTGLPVVQACRVSRPRCPGGRVSRPRCPGD
jgi:hypothetical protein